MKGIEGNRPHMDLTILVLRKYCCSNRCSDGYVATDQIVIAKGGNGPGDGTGNGPGDCAYMSTDNLLILAGNGPGDGDGNDGVGPGDGTGNGPGDCA